MKFPRNARIFRGQLDAAPFATVFFLLLLFLFLSSLTYTPGVRLQLPMADNLPGTDKTKVAVAVDATGRLYFANQLIQETELKTRLQTMAKSSSESLLLVIQADKDVPYDKIVRLAVLARDAGVNEAWLATLPRAFATPVRRSP